MDSGNRHSGIGGGWQREASLRARLQELAANRVQSAVNELSGRITHEQLADADLGRHIIGKHPQVLSKLKCPVFVASEMYAWRAARVGEHAKHGFLHAGRDGAEGS